MIKTTRYQLCELVDHQLKHYYFSERNGIGFFSRNKATTLSVTEASDLLNHYRTTEPSRDIFVQSEYDCHYRQTDMHDYVLAV